MERLEWIASNGQVIRQCIQPHVDLSEQHSLHTVRHIITFQFPRFTVKHFHKRLISMVPCIQKLEDEAISQSIATSRFNRLAAQRMKQLKGKSRQNDL